MDKITISAKTLDEAIYKAQLELHVTSSRLQYEIVQNASSGVFGIFGVKDCIIRAWEISEEEQRTQKKAEAEKKEAPKSTPVKEPVKKEIPKKEAQKKEAPKAEKKQPEREAAVSGSEEKKAPEKSERRKERRDGGRKERPVRREEAVAEKASAEKPAETKPAKQEKPRQPVKADPEKVQAAAKNFLVDVFGAMGMTVSIETFLNLEEGELQVMMVGEDMGILIGKRGQTLDSLQYLVSLVVNKETEGYLRVKLDTENYRERRRETLETLARNISYKVKRTKRPVSLEPMNPYERRIIHSALQNDRFVVTRSEGEDPYRHVVISLKNDRYGSRDKGYASRKERYAKNAERQAEKKQETVEVKAEMTAEASEE